MAPATAVDPLWLAHRYDPGHDAVHFRAVSREARGGAPFLTDEYLGETEPVVLRRLEAAPAQGSVGTLHFIFHSAYCCSTLLARALDVPGAATTLKEPVILNDIVGWRRRGGSAASVREALDTSLALLARPFSAREAMIVKPSNAVAAMMPEILDLRPRTRAVLLHAPLPDYLASIAKKGMAGRLWVRKLLSGLLSDGLIDLGLEPGDYLELTDLQAAAVGWLAQQAQFHRLVDRYGPSRVRTLDSGEFLEGPALTIGSLAEFFGLELSAGDAATVASGPEFTRNAKSGLPYDVGDRMFEQKDAAALHADELAMVETWARAVAASARLPLELGSRLLGTA